MSGEERKTTLEEFAESQSGPTEMFEGQSLKNIRERNHFLKNRRGKSPDETRFHYQKTLVRETSKTPIRFKEKEKRPITGDSLRDARRGNKRETQQKKGIKLTDQASRKIPPPEDPPRLQACSQNAGT